MESIDFGSGEVTLHSQRSFSSSLRSEEADFCDDANTMTYRDAFCKNQHHALQDATTCVTADGTELGSSSYSDEKDQLTEADILEADPRRESRKPLLAQSKVSSKHRDCEDRDVLHGRTCIARQCQSQRPCFPCLEDSPLRQPCEEELSQRTSARSGALPLSSVPRSSSRSASSPQDIFGEVEEADELETDDRVERHSKGAPLHEPPTPQENGNRASLSALSDASREMLCAAQEGRVEGQHWYRNPEETAELYIRAQWPSRTRSVKSRSRRASSSRPSTVGLSLADVLAGDPLMVERPSPSPQRPAVDDEEININEEHIADNDVAPATLPTSRLWQRWAARERSVRFPLLSPSVASDSDSCEETERERVLDCSVGSGTSSHQPIDCCETVQSPDHAWHLSTTHLPPSPTAFDEVTRRTSSNGTATTPSHMQLSESPTGQEEREQPFEPLRPRGLSKRPHSSESYSHRHGLPREGGTVGGTRQSVPFAEARETLKRPCRNADEMPQLTLASLDHSPTEDDVIAVEEEDLVYLSSEEEDDHSGVSTSPRNLMEGDSRRETSPVLLRVSVTREAPHRTRGTRIHGCYDLRREWAAQQQLAEWVERDYQGVMATSSEERLAPHAKNVSCSDALCGTLPTRRERDVASVVPDALEALAALLRHGHVSAPVGQRIDRQQLWHAASNDVPPPAHGSNTLNVLIDSLLRESESSVLWHERRRAGGTPVPVLAITNSSRQLESEPRRTPCVEEPVREARIRLITSAREARARLAWALRVACLIAPHSRELLLLLMLMAEEDAVTNRGDGEVSGLVTLSTCAEAANRILEKHAFGERERATERFCVDVLRYTGHRYHRACRFDGSRVFSGECHRQFSKRTEKVTEYATFVSSILELCHRGKHRRTFPE